MKQIAEFTIIGRAGNIKTVGTTVRVNIASNYSFKDANGNWQDDAHWNEITVFAKTTQSYVEKYLEKGDLVFARGRVRQDSYEKNGERVYTVNLVCNDFSILAKASAKSEAPAAEPAPVDENIPF